MSTLRFKYFKREGACSKCEKAKDTIEMLKSTGCSVSEYDIDELNGYSEAAFYGVLSVPTLVLIKEYNNGKCDEDELARWVGDTINDNAIIEKFNAINNELSRKLRE